MYSEPPSLRRATPKAKDSPEERAHGNALGILIHDIAQKKPVNPCNTSLCAASFMPDKNIVKRSFKVHEAPVKSSLALRTKCQQPLRPENFQHNSLKTVLFLAIHNASWTCARSAHKEISDFPHCKTLWDLSSKDRKSS